MPSSSSLAERVSAALYWTGSFALASGVFLVAQKHLRNVPPTDPIAVGRVTVERASKLEDYLTAALFYLLVPLLTVIFRRVFPRIVRHLMRGHAFRRREELSLVLSFLFCAPLLLSPFFFLTTRKEGWTLLLPVVLGWGLAVAFSWYERSLALRELMKGAPSAHALLLLEGISWVVFRYLATGKRIAHFDTLFLEVVFALFFLALFWGIAAWVARMAVLAAGGDWSERLTQLAVASIPFLALPVVGLTSLPAGTTMIVVIAVVFLAGAFLVGRRARWSQAALRRMTAWFFAPTLIFVTIFASVVQLSTWIDLFHRGESLGPAADYLRGKVPYRDVFVLHGMLDDGLLDAWLMTLFGRSAEVALMRPIVLGSLMLPLVWLLALTVLRSMPAAFLAVGLTAVTSVENQRAVPELLCVLLLFGSVLRGRLWMSVAAGAVAGAALFFSLDIGIYSVSAGLASLLLLAVMSRRSEIVVPAGSVLLFAAGCLVGMAPFAAYLASKGVLGHFVHDSFVLIPGIIDAVWSLPFPDLTRELRGDFSLRVVSEFFLSARFRFILNPLVIGIAAAWLLFRYRHGWRKVDSAIAVIALFALVTQRSALGRADFPHQHFSAFLVAPLLTLLITVGVGAARERWRDDSREGRIFVAAFALSLLPLFTVLFWVPDLLDARLTNLVSYRARLAGFIADQPSAEAVADRIDALTREVSRLTRPGDTLFDFSNQPALYFFLDRPNATRFYQIPILSPLPLQLEAIRDLERSKPPVVLRESPEQYDEFDGIENDLRAPSLAMYIDDHYRFLRSVRGVEIWRREPASGPFAEERYRQQPAIPRATEIAPEARLVFPAVGSLEGAGGSSWRSDLLLYNSFPEPSSLTLRFRSEQANIDRKMTLEPRSFRLIDDVAKELFGAPGALGTLWIEYRQNRPPLARLRSYDAARRRSGAFHDPLSAAVAASAGEYGNELLLTGVAGGEGKRVNLGAINIGDRPCAFRVTASTLEGKSIGRTLESGLPERRSLLLVDIEQRLGVVLDGTVVLRVRMLNGTAVAYATVVDGVTGEQQTIAALPVNAP